MTKSVINPQYLGVPDEAIVTDMPPDEAEALLDAHPLFIDDDNSNEPEKES